MTKRALYCICQKKAVTLRALNCARLLPHAYYVRNLMKRFFYILGVFLVSLLLVGAMLVCVLTSDKVETAAVRLVTKELSRGLGTEAKIGRVEYKFPARLRIRNIYLADQQGDTLLYLDEIYAHFRPLPLWQNEIRFSRVDIRGGVANVYRLNNEQYNYQFLVDAFHSERERTPFRSFLSVRDIRIEQIRARYNDYQAQLDHAYMDLYHFTLDSLDAEVRSLSLAVQNQTDQLYVEELQARLVYNDTLLGMPRLYIRLPQSELDASGVKCTISKGASNHEEHNGHCTIDHSTTAGRLLTEGNTIRLHITRAEVTPRDLALIVPAVRSLDKPIRITGDVFGTVDSIQAQDLSLHYNNQRFFAGSLTASGLPDISDPYLKMSCQDLFLNARFLQDLLSDLYNRPYRLSKEVHRLGDIHYRGQIEGRLHDMILRGAFRTALGVITTDGQLQSDTVFRNMTYNARIATKRFQLGKLLGNTDLGPISLDVSSRGKVVSGKASGNINAHVRNLTYKDYTYEELRANGQFRPQHFDGTVSINDENIEMYFSGLVNLTQKQPDINCDLRLVRLRPGVLQLSPKLEKMEISSTMAINLSGRNLDDMSGYLVLDSTRLRNGNDSVLMNQLKLIVQTGVGTQKQIHLTSDYLTAGVNGQFRYKELPDMLLRQAMRYLPNAFTATEQYRIRQTQRTHSRIDVYVYGHKLRALQRVLRLPTRISDQPVIKGFLHEDKNIFGLMAYAPGVRINGKTIQDITLSLDNIGNSANLSLAAEALNMGAILRATAEGDSLSTHLTLHQTDSAAHVYGGDIRMQTHFMQYAGKPLIDMHIQPSEFQLRDSTYTISDSHISYCVADTTLGIQNFNIQAAHQFVRATGMASTRATDSLYVELGNIDAGYVLPFVLPEDALKLGGSLTGWATLYSLFSKPVFEADVRLDSAQLNDTYVGDAVATVALDKTTKDIVINGDVVKDSRLLAHVDGNVETNKGKWGIMIYPDSIPLSFINHWTQGIISDISGYGSGVVHVFGEREGDTKRTWVETRAKAIDAGLTIPYTGCRYYLSDSIFMDSTSIQFNHLNLYDEEGNRLHVDGKLTHNIFNDFRYKFDIQVFDALVFNLPDKAGEMLQGRVYANGDAHIKGNTEEVKISANARTVGKSRFRFSIDYASSASDNNFITFVDHNAVIKQRPQDEDEEDDLSKELAKIESSIRMQIALNVEADQHLLFQLMLGERNGDMIQARGDGAIRFTYDSQNDDIKLMGNYNIQQGSLDFTVGNVIHRQFTIAEGGNILWSGNPMTPQLNVTAKYRVTASLKDLFGSEISQLATTRTNVPVNTCLTMTGNLMQPTLRFGIELPLSDEAIQSQVQSIINTDEMLMRQVVYLLVFGRFFTPESMSNSQYSGLNDTYSLLSSTITGQINSWLSKLTNVFTMGVNIRTDGEGADATQEYEAQFQLQPMDRLVINGNVGYRYNDITNQPFFGDLDAEVMLTEDGKLRLKAYTHTVDKYSLRQANTIQGVGFVWKHDFNWPTKEDLQQRKTEREKQKAERKVTKQQTDSTQITPYK